MEHVPNPAGRNIYFWHDATQVMHPAPGADWDNWNRKIRQDSHHQPGQGRLRRRQLESRWE